MPSILKVNLEKEEMEYYEDITLRNGGELENLTRIDVDANELKELVAKEDESTSLKLNEKREEVVETFPEMTLWGQVYKELKNEKMTPLSKVDVYIVQLDKELEDNIVKKKRKKIQKNDRGRLCTQVAD